MLLLLSLYGFLLLLCCFGADALLFVACVAPLTEPRSENDGGSPYLSSLSLSLLSLLSLLSDAAASVRFLSGLLGKYLRLALAPAQGARRH